MSKPYKRPGAATWSYDFKWQGRRFSGNTECTSRRDAEKWISRHKTQLKAATTVHRHGEDLSIRDAVARYWHQSGQYHKRPKETDRDLGWLVTALGPDRMLSSVTNSDVADLIARRRGEGLSTGSVNRYVIHRLRAVMIMARDEWDAPVRSLNWKKLRLKESKVRIREMTPDEEQRTMDALTPRYIPIVMFAVLSGFRLDEAVSLRWRDIDWHNETISLTGKGDKPAMIPLSRSLRGLIRQLPRTSETVFGVTYSGVKSAWRRCRAKSGVVDLKFHDLRHTCATRALRDGMDIRLVKDLLRHEDIATTMRYAHVTMADLRKAMDATNPVPGYTQNHTRTNQTGNK